MSTPYSEKADPAGGKQKSNGKVKVKSLHNFKRKIKRMNRNELVDLMQQMDCEAMNDKSEKARLWNMDFKLEEEIKLWQRTIVDVQDQLEHLKGEAQKEQTFLVKAVTCVGLQVGPSTSSVEELTSESYEICDKRGAQNEQAVRVISVMSVGLQVGPSTPFLEHMKGETKKEEAYLVKAVTCVGLQDRPSTSSDNMEDSPIPNDEVHDLPPTFENLIIE